MNRSKIRRQSDRLTVSLFPFLAVLICTLGILIVLLVISVQSATVEADVRSTASQTEQMKQLRDTVERGQLLDFEAQNVKSVRADVSQRLAISKSDRSYLQQQIQELETEARSVYLQYRELQKRRERKKSIETQDKVTKAELDRLEEDVSRVQRQIDLKRAELPQIVTNVNYQIVPYTGAGGTARRPIFIECDANGLLLQPLDILLKKSDFIDPNRIGNVLDSALLAIREYYQKHGLAKDETKPYPLLIVRPEGAWAYSLARRAMKSWDDEFGYELVDRDTPLQFGNRDALLEKQIRKTIETAHRRQLAIAARSKRGSGKFGTVWRDGGGVSDSSALGTTPTGLGAGNENWVRQASHESNQNKSDSVRFSGGSQEGSSNSGSTDSFSPTGGQAVGGQVFEERAVDGNVVGGSGGQGQVGATPASMSNTTSAARSMARQRGVNWALPSQMTGSRAYIRPIRVACDQKRIHILSQDEVVATIPLGERTENAVDPLVSEIWKTIDQWGIAGQNAFWKPELRFSVLPGGQQRFADLQKLLDQSGLILEVAQ